MLAPAMHEREQAMRAGLAVLLWLCACGTSEQVPAPSRASGAPEADGRAAARARMIETLERVYGFSDDEVLAAMWRVPRERMVPERYRDRAYADHPLPIGHGQTISQPYVVAVMTRALRVREGDRVLEVGTGSGYQAAVLAEMGARVYTIEIVPELAERARRTLADLGYADRVTVRTGDGYAGWPEHAPFDAIIVTAAPDHVPQPLVDQLAPGGRLVIPVGRGDQELVLIEKTAGR